MVESWKNEIQTATVVPESPFLRRENKRSREVKTVTTSSRLRAICDSDLSQLSLSHVGYTMNGEFLCENFDDVNCREKYCK